MTSEHVMVKIQEAKLTTKRVQNGNMNTVEAGKILV
jgi:hypothetical protein